MPVLNWELVGEIKDKWEGGNTQSSLATEYGVSLNTISKIVKGQSWTRPQQGGRKVPGRGLENPEEILGRMLALQERVDGRRASPPTSLLDGGDCPDETGGAGMVKLLEADNERTL